LDGNPISQVTAQFQAQPKRLRRLSVTQFEETAADVKPDAQTTQPPVAPVVARYLPAAQLAHEPWPMLGWYFPAAQWVQLVAAGDEYWPAAQVKQPEAAGPP
jgi:hypothetical protein